MRIREINFSCEDYYCKNRDVIELQGTAGSIECSVKSVI